MKNIPSRLKTLIGGIIKKAYLYGFFYNIFSRLYRVNNEFVLLESHHGTDFFGSPYYIAKYLASSPDFSSYHLIMAGPSARARWLKKQLGFKNIKTVKPNGLRYAYYLARCKWLVSDVTFPLYFSRRKEQEYLNTWHGTPLKALGRDVANESFSHVSNIQRNFLHSTHLLAPNTYTEDILLDAYMLRNIWEGQVFRCGYPRNDVLFNSRETKFQAKHINIAFMPTWRGNFTTKKQASFALLEDLRELLNFLDGKLPKSIKLWVRLHPMVLGYINLKCFKNIQAFPAEVEPYEHLAACHALVTDYSSVMFDYANTLNPIVLYTPDEEAYRTDRNMYMDFADLPFQQTRNPEGLLQAILHIGETRELSLPDESYLMFVENFCQWDDGENTARLCRAFFGKENTLVSHHYTPTKEKQRILFYAGALLNNGIIRSFKTLLPLIDRQKFDITILADSGYKLDEAESYFYKLDHDIKYIPLRLCTYISPLEAAKLLVKYLFHKQWKNDSSVFHRVWEREYKRIIGNANFDVFVNFNGYSWKAAFLSLGIDFKKVIYVHNEMVKEIYGNKVADSRLLQLSYEASDIVSIVRKGIGDEYCSTFYNYKNKTIYTPNPLLLDVAERASYSLENSLSENQSLKIIEKTKKSIIDKEKFNFINIARFSPEKGQKRLIEAFEILWKSNKNIQLFLVGGYGICFNELQEKAAHSSAKEAIFIVIGSQNPFPLVKLADVFVLSSFHEGLPLVLFEAMQLNLPIITTDIPGPSELLQEGYGLVVENSVEGLIKGMQAAIDNKIPRKPYDFSSHNALALSQFYECVRPISENA